MKLNFYWFSLYLVLIIASRSFAETTVPAQISQNTQNKNEKKAPAPIKVFEGADSSNRRELTEDELMQKFFNKKAQPKNNDKSKIMLPIFYESMSQPLTQIRTRATSKISGLENIEVDADAVIAVLIELVDPQWFQKIDPVKTNCAEKLKEALKVNPSEKDFICWVPISVFADSDVVVNLDERAMEIRVKVIPTLRSVKVASITHVSRFVEDVTHEPNWFSSYVNMNFNQSFQSDNVVYKNGREPLTAYFDSATRFGSILIEANGRGREKREEIVSNEPVLVRENVRGVLDFPSIDSRSQLGDLTYPVKSFQIYRPMAGVSLFTQSSLKSSQIMGPGGSYELNLLRPSKVAIFLNEKLVQTIDLPAGRHDVRDFPFVNGQNDLKLEITDDLGRKESKDFSILLTNELMKPGEHEISYSFGIPSTEVDGNRNYDSKKSTVSLFHRYGFSQVLSLGANIQADPYQQVGGFEFLFTTSLGYFSIEPAYSLNQDHAAGYAARFRYVMQDLYGISKSNKFTSIEGNVLSSDFAAFGTRDPVNVTSLKLQATHSRGVTQNTSVNLGFNYNFNRELTPDIGNSYSVSLGASQRWNEGLNANLSFRHSRLPTGTDEISILLFLIWTSPKDHQFVTVSSESASGSSRADWTYQPKGGVGSSRSRLNILNKQSGSGYGGDFEYTANRARMSASHQIEVMKADLNSTPPTPSKSVHSTNLQLGTALVFAGGNFGLSRPIYDSFALFVPLKNIKDENIQLNPQKDGVYYGETDWLGPAVATELPSYTTSTMILKQKEIKLGVALPKDHFTFKPTYRSGYRILIGTDATIYLKTTILNFDETPASMIAGEAFYLDDPSVEPVSVFTNRNGLLRSEGFRHGRYKLNINGDGIDPVEFVIPESASDEFEMPAIKLKEGKK